MVVIMNSWIVMVFPSVPLKPIYSTCNSFPYLFSDLFFYGQHGGCFETSRGRLPYRCTWPMLPVSLLCMYDFAYFLFFVPGLHSSDFSYSLGSLDYSFWTHSSDILIQVFLLLVDQLVVQILIKFAEAFICQMQLQGIKQ